MIVNSFKQLENTERDVKFKEGRSIRQLLKSDGMGFSIHRTIIPKGEIGNWHYKNHLEACYCIEGTGLLTDIKNDKQYCISKGFVYALNNNDNHTFEAITDVVLISVFNPPVTGNEIHQEDGSYKKIDKGLKSIATEIVETVCSCKSNYDAVELVTEKLSR